MRPKTMARRAQKSTDFGSDKPRMGRPPVDDPMEVVAIRLGTSDRAKLDALAVGKERRSDVVRRLIRDAHGRKGH